MGDPAGIGPEIIVKALDDKNIYRLCRPLILGDPEVISSTILKTSKNISVNVISNMSNTGCIPGTINLIAISNLKIKSIKPGRPTIEGGKAMVEYILRAVEMTCKKEIGAMVTCPINKDLMNRAGYRYEGHTQLISEMTDTDDYVMMLAGKRLRVALATIHCALKDVPALLSKEIVNRTITITARALEQDFGLKKPCIAVAGLNPHAGESGMFGTEEEDIINPAIRRARDDGWCVEGPLPPDTLFYKAASGQFDAVVAMYHDQGLIPLKLLHFSDAVNITLGLPIVRTSVDHGTAYDIAGSGKADPASLKSAIRMAVEIIRNRRKAEKSL
ncbi:MAG: 4-hydroxythreonine-4-phosphate dehydrogenase PdxA [Deltaproteobacteria bacterium]|nr:4-hydroxythreonine-4-phosphate dehydrogenase PdxA [Deltaproteobacteria bacterium]